MSDFLNELDTILELDTPAKEPEPVQTGPDIEALTQRLQQMESTLNEVTERNRKLTQFALGDQASDITDQSMSEYMQKKPIDYTNSVVETTTKRVQEQTAQQLAELQTQLAVNAAIDRAKQTYPVYASLEKNIEPHVLKVIEQIDNGQIKNIKRTDYDSIINKGVQDFYKDVTGAFSGRDQLKQVMNMDIGNSQNVYGNPTSQDRVKAIESMSDEDFKAARAKALASNNRPSRFS